MDFDRPLVHRSEIFFPKLGNIANLLQTASKVWLFLAANSNSVIALFFVFGSTNRQYTFLDLLEVLKCVGGEGASGAGGVDRKSVV